MFHLGAIEAFTGTLARKKEVDAMPPYEIGLNPAIRDRIIEFVDSVGLKTVGRATQSCQNLNREIIVVFVENVSLLMVC